MTNAEKYLKDGVIYHNLSCELAIFISNSLKKGMVANIDEFFKQQAKPTLTEDERVILRNIGQEWKTICRHNGQLELLDSLPEKDKMIQWLNLYAFNHLFQFIKERRRI